jgi:toxin-antitoxin system PIN domain toxin
VILCDVGVLLNAMVERAPNHEVCRRELERLLSRPEDVAISDLILVAVVRIATNPRVLQPAPSTEDAFAFVDALRASTAVTHITPGARHWRIFRDLVFGGAIRGSDTTDAYLAALAIEHGCEWWTTDAGFSRFPGLRWRNLLG